MGEMGEVGEVDEVDDDSDVDEVKYYTKAFENFNVLANFMPIVRVDTEARDRLRI